MNNDERNGCVLTQRKVFRSLESFLFTYHVTSSCCHFWRETCSLQNIHVHYYSVNSDAINILLKVMYRIYQLFVGRN